MKDEGLVNKAKSGDKNALIKLILEKDNMLRKIAYSYLKIDHDVDDALQDTILNAFKNIKNLKDPDYFYTWYIRILINNCKKILNSKSKIIYIDNYDDRLEYKSNENIEEIMDLKNVINSLKPEHREVLYLKHYGDLKGEDIAYVLDCPVGTVKSRIYYATKEIREKLLGKERTFNECK